MQDHVYKVIEIVGSSETGIDDAIRTAVERAGQTIRHIRWFKVKEVRGHVEDGRVRHFQVTLKIGFTLDDAEGADDVNVAQMRVAAGAEPGTDPLHEGP